MTDSKYLIRIDRSTIRRNPDYSKPINIQGRSELIVTFYGDIPEDLESKFIIISSEHSWDTTVITAIASGDINDAIDYLNKLDPYKFAFDLTKKNNIITFDYCGSEFLYLYEHPFFVTCKRCKSSFDYKRLKSDITELCGYYASSDMVCPVCSMWNCVDIEFEKLDSVL